MAGRDATGLQAGRGGAAAEDWSAVRGLRDLDDEEGWNAFFSAHRELIFNMARKAGCTNTEAEEVVQETVICVARQVGRFRMDSRAGSFQGWLQTIVRRRIVDQFRLRGRNRLRAPDDGGPVPDLDAIPCEATTEDSFETRWHLESCRHLVQSALDSVRAQVSPLQYELFHLVAVQEMPVDRVSRVTGASAENIYLARHRVGKVFRRAVLAAGELPSAAGFDC